jgi:8-oxo-dGTP pyrophosphatase MutT (NUDIX family)
MNILTMGRLEAAFAGDATRKTLTIPNYRRAAVLVPLIASNDSFDLLFTQRTHTVETHKGQISFPGGVVDDGDKDIVHTALREAEEEIGLPHASVEVIGMLNDMATPTGFVITPIVGVIHSLPSLTSNADEVAEVFHVPLDFFADEGNGRSEMREINGKHHEVWFYDYKGKTIWGVTAVIVRALVSKLDMEVRSR